MEIYVVNFYGAMTQDGYWTAGAFTDRARADRVCAWLNEIMKLNHELWKKEMDAWDRKLGGPVGNKRSESVQKMDETIHREGYYEVQPEQVFDTAAEWMNWHSQKNYQGMADWPDVVDVEVGLADHDPKHPLADEARQLRLF